jgi:hypothetical protein
MEISEDKRSRESGIDPAGSAHPRWVPGLRPSLSGGAGFPFMRISGPDISIQYRGIIGLSELPDTDAATYSADFGLVFIRLIPDQHQSMRHVSAISPPTSPIACSALPALTTEALQSYPRNRGRSCRQCFASSHPPSR